MCGAWIKVCALPLKETKRPKQDPHRNYLISNKRVLRAILATQSGMLRSHAAQQ